MDARLKVRHVEGGAPEGLRRVPKVSFWRAERRDASAGARTAARVGAAERAHWPASRSMLEATPQSSRWKAPRSRQKTSQSVTAVTVAVRSVRRMSASSPKYPPVVYDLSRLISPLEVTHEASAAPEAST